MKELAYGPDLRQPPSHSPFSRTTAHTHAQINGYFWLPCPLCGTEFSGSEWGDGVINDPAFPRLTGRGVGICPWCEYDGKGEETLEAAERVKPGNSALVAEIRRVVNAWVTNRGEPIDAFGIARSVEYANRDRWSEASIRTAIARAGLRAVDTEGRSPRGQRCLRYVIKEA